MRIPALGLRRKQWEPLAFASPSMALIAFVIVFPLVYSFYLSFQNFDLSVGPEYEFVGAKNYTEALFRDERFMGSVWNTALLIAPVSYHRLVFRRNLKRHLIGAANVMAILGLATVGLTVSAAVVLVLSYVARGLPTVLLGVFVIGLFAGLWFVFPLTRHWTRQPESPESPATPPGPRGT